MAEQELFLRNWCPNYNLREFISKGSFGEIYQAWCLTQQRIVSIKRISLLDSKGKNKQSEVDTELRNQAIREAENLHKMRTHPHILRTVDVNYYFEGSHYKEPIFCIVTEYCENGDLFQCIEEHKISNAKISRMKIIKWLIQLSSAVAHLHESNLVHRDITPRNIYLRNGFEDIKLGDFGLSKYVNDTPKSYRNGTLHYQAPEAISNPGEKKLISDCWSIGCVMFEILNLSRLIKEAPLEKTIAAIKTEAIPEIQHEEYASLFEKMMTREESKRIASSKIKEELDYIKKKIVLSTENFQDYKKDREEFKTNFNELRLIDKNAFDGQELEHLDLSKNKLTLTEEKQDEKFYVFSNQTKLVELKLNQNRIETLGDSLFEALKMLKVLWLQENQIKRLANQTFSQLKDLHTLRLDKNKISDIESDVVFDSLVNLVNLNLFKNELGNLFKNKLDNSTSDLGGLFKNLAKLREFNLGSNGLTELPSTIFERLKELMVLKLDKNQLTSIDSLVFSKLNELDELDLSSNQISRFIINQNHPFEALSNLSKLSLSENKLETLNLDWFAKLSNLVELYVSKNMISAIENGSTNEKLDKLETIDLSGNRLTQITKACWTRMPNLLSIRLDNNEIAQIHEDAFDELTSLEELYLENNRFPIEQIEVIFTKNNNINILNLSGNDNLDNLKSDRFTIRNNMIVESIYSKN